MAANVSDLANAVSLLILITRNSLGACNRNIILSSN